MADAAVAAAPEEAQGEGAMGGMFRSLMMFMAVQSGMRMLLGAPDANRFSPKHRLSNITDPSDLATASVAAPERAESALEKWAKARLPPKEAPAPVFKTHDANGRRLPPQANVWAEGERFDVHAYTSCAENNTRNSFEHLWTERGLSHDYASTNNRERTFYIGRKNASRCSRRAWENVTVYVHVFASVAINHWSRPAWDIFKPLYLAQIELVFHDS